jgi:hypothetical protein
MAGSDVTPGTETADETGGLPSWPAAGQDEYYALHSGPYGTPVTYLGGESITPLDRVLLDLLGQVEHSISEHRSVLPPRYELNNPGADRDTGAIDSLRAVYEYLTGRRSLDAVRMVVEVLRDRGRPEEIRVLEQWVRENPVRLDGPGLPPEPPRTMTSTETAALARLQAASATEAVSAPVASEAVAADTGHAAFMTRLASTLCSKGETLSVSSGGVAIIDAEGDEVSVLTPAQLPGAFAQTFTDAYEALVSERGVCFAVTPRSFKAARPASRGQGRAVRR